MQTAKVKHGYIIRSVWVCENACGRTHLKLSAAEECEARYARKRNADTWTCPDCGQAFVRGNSGPAQVEATMRRHERSARHFAAVAAR